jgi:hypothetical protein
MDFWKKFWMHLQKARIPGIDGCSEWPDFAKKRLVPDGSKMTPVSGTIFRFIETETNSSPSSFNPARWYS